MSSLSVLQCLNWWKRRHIIAQRLQRSYLSRNIGFFMKKKYKFL
jgi:hypothetical protein